MLKKPHVFRPQEVRVTWEAHQTSFRSLKDKVSPVKDSQVKVSHRPALDARSVLDNGRLPTTAAPGSFAARRAAA